MARISRTSFAVRLNIAQARYSIPPFGVDVFDSPLRGLILAECEFDDDATMHSFSPPCLDTRRSHFRLALYPGSSATIGPWPFSLSSQIQLCKFSDVRSSDPKGLVTVRCTLGLPGH